VEHLGPGPCHKANATTPALVKALGAGASIEQLQQTLKLPAGRLASDLLELELAGQVVCESGFLWKPCRP
jgi:DNA processing protein